MNSGYWQKTGYYVIDSGIAPECYSTPNSAALVLLSSDSLSL